MTQPPGQIPRTEFFLIKIIVLQFFQNFLLQNFSKQIFFRTPLDQRNSFIVEELYWYKTYLNKRFIWIATCCWYQRLIGSMWNILIFSVITELFFKINKTSFKNLLAQTSWYLEFCLNSPNQEGNYHCYDRDHGVF